MVKKIPASQIPKQTKTWSTNFRKIFNPKLHTESEREEKKQKKDPCNIYRMKRKALIPMFLRPPFSIMARAPFRAVSFSTKATLPPDEGTAAVVEDPVRPGTVWEQGKKDVEAEQRRKAVTSPGFSFSAAGHLLPYHLGAARFLIEKGYIKETTPLAGSSAGSIVCAAIVSGESMEEALKATKIVAQDCRLRGTAFRVGALLRDFLDRFLPDDAHIRSNGRIRVAVTEILWRPRGVLVDYFDSKEDLINAVFTSSFIPGYLAPRPATMFRDRLCIDGGLTLFMPPTSASQTVRVCAFPAGRLGLKGIGISPDCNPENRAGARELLNLAFQPATDDVLDRYFELGYVDAAAWAEKNPVDEIVRQDKDDRPTNK
ncbi:patatin-like phospholipase domain-containing protein 4 [Salvia splendens]|uniref:patatin-like phospholipase domain-containing protein 4 n=1 Tax=Salvia splendens TaxID=180675 RepID=UPI001C261D0F|nr:patatin-like phospholipase domain-containing protein 4 [Salvia splendens]